MDEPNAFLYSTYGPPQSCSAAKHCGNAAITVRHNGMQDIPLCESCATEHDENS